MQKLILWTTLLLILLLASCSQQNPGLPSGNDQLPVQAFLNQLPITSHSATTDALNGKLAYDQNINTSWGSTNSGSLTLKLAQISTIDEMHLAFAMVDPEVQLVIDTSLDDLNWSNVYNGKARSTTDAFIKVALPDTVAQFVRVTVISPVRDRVNGIREIAIIGSATAPMLEVSGATASTTNSVPKNVLDGNFSTIWSASKVGDYLELTLASNAKIDSLGLAFSDGLVRKTDFGIELSLDKVSWTQVLRKTSSATNGLQAINITDTVARYIRIVAYGPETTRPLNLSEVKVFGKVTTPPSDITFDIKIDTSVLSSTTVDVSSIDSTGKAASITGSIMNPGVQTLKLKSNAKYRVCAPAPGELTDSTCIYFKVNTNGTISYDASVANMVQGLNTSTIKVIGLPITIDTTKLSAYSINISRYDASVGRQISVTTITDSTVKTLNLLPAPDYLLCTSRIHSCVPFSISSSGQVGFDDSYAKVMSGSGTNKLVITGFDITLNTENVAASTLNIWVRDPETNLTYDLTRSVPNTGIRQLGLLASQHYEVCLPATQNCLSFYITKDGLVDYPDALSDKVFGRGTSTLTVGKKETPPPPPAPKLCPVADSNLERAIRAKLNKPSGALTEADMLSLTTLSAVSAGIRSLSGLECAKNLQVLGLASNSIQDVRPVQSLTQLTELYLQHNPVGNIDALAGLRNMRILFVENTGISSLTSVANMTELVELYASFNSISDLSPISRLFKLQLLELSYNKVSSVSSLASLTSLKKLYLRHNQISTVSSLANLTQLTHLYIYNNNISSIGDLSRLVNLVDLRFSYNQIRSIDSLGAMTKLQTVFANFNLISDMGVLVRNGGITSSDQVYLRDNCLNFTTDKVDIDALYYLQNVKNMNLTVNLPDIRAQRVTGCP